ncbi:hypothetical protein Tco_0735095 [Tanacetum coccineum]
MEIHKPLSKDADGTDVDVHLYRSMIGSLMYLTSSRPDIMFAVCACSRFQVQPKASHMHAIKRIFRYLKGQPTLGLWYPKDSPMDLIAYSDSDYAGASLDRKSTTGGCQFLGCRLISWQCKKQTIVANSTTEAEYIAASNCCGQVLWLQNQLLDYGYNFMQTKIHVDNESAICVVKNHVYHSKTKHIEIRHHFIRDSYEKRLIEMVKIHTDYNVADLLTKAFDVTRFQFLIASIGLELKGYLINNGYADLVRMLKELAIPRQTATGKEFSNPLMAGSLLKTINENADFGTSALYQNSTILVKPIHVIDDGKSWMVISESSVTSDLLFNDEDGITCLINDEIFENLALMGYEQVSTKLTFQKEPQIKSLQIETPLTAAPQTEARQTAVSQIVFHDAHIEQILPSPTTYQRKRKTQKCRRTKKDTELPQTSVPQDLRVDEAIHKEGGYRWQSQAPRNHGGTPAQTRSERVLEQPNEPPLTEGHTSRSGEGRMEQTFELINSVLPTPYDSPLKGGYTPGSDEEDASKHGRNSDKTKPMFKESDFDGLEDEIGNVEEEKVYDATSGVSAVSVPVTTAGITISTAELRTPPTTAASRTPPTTTIKEKAKEKGVVIKDSEDSSRPVKSITTLQPLLTIYHKDKVQARMDANYELAARLTHEEQEKYTIEERVRLLAEFFERRKKQLAAKRAEALRNKPPTETQLRNLMMTYLKNMGGYKHNQLKGKTYEEIQGLYEK